jgi:hypothetical protein
VYSGRLSCLAALETQKQAAQRPLQLAASFIRANGPSSGGEAGAILGKTTRNVGSATFGYSRPHPVRRRCSVLLTVLISQRVSVLVCEFLVNCSRSEQNGTAPKWRCFHLDSITALYRHLPVTESSITLPPDLRRSIMPTPAILFDSSRVAIQPHPCPKCSCPMVLAYIQPSGLGFERRVFQGVNCNHTDKVVTETHSVKWMSSGLRAPA